MAFRLFGSTPAADSSNSATATDEKKVPNNFVDRPLIRRKIVKACDTIYQWKFGQGDQVQIMAGRGKGQRGVVKECNKLTNYVRVEGCLLRPLRDPRTSKIHMVEETVHYSRIALIDPVYRKPTKVALRMAANCELLRISKLSGAVIPWAQKCGKTFRFPDSPRATSGASEGPKDTEPDAALEFTYHYQKDKDERTQWRQSMPKYNHSLVVY